MTREATPLPEPPQGSRKRTLSTKAKEYTDSHVSKKTKTVNSDATRPVQEKSSKQKKRTIIENHSDSDEQSPAPVKGKRRHYATAKTIEREDNANSQSPLPEGQEDNAPAPTQPPSPDTVKKPETAEEELSMIETIYLSKYSPWSYRPSIQNLDLPSLHLFPCHSTY